MADFIQPFDFQTIIVDYLLGGTQLFPFFFIIVVSSMAAYFRMPTKIFLILFVIGLLLYSFILGEVVYVFVLFILGIIIFKSLTRLFT